MKPDSTKHPSTRTGTGRTLTPTLVGLAAAGAYFAVLLAGGLLHGSKASVISPNFIIYLNPWIYAVAWLIVAGILVAYGTIAKRFVYGFAWLAALGYAIRTAVSGGSYYLTFALCGVIAIMTVIVGRALRNEPKPNRKKARVLSPTIGKIVVGSVSIVTGGVVLFFLISSYLSHTTSSGVSTGVYVQLLSSLRERFSFVTTLEFGESVSHLAAHFSPIFLVYLPFYFLVPSPVTLLVLQGVAVFSAVIPLWLIARRRGVSVGGTTMLCVLLCLFPAVFGGAAGSLHEYALLLPLLLWLMWAFETRKNVLMWVLAALVLCVRETAAIHLLTLSLYWWITNRRAADTDNSKRKARVQAMIMAGVSLVYFVIALILLTHLGRGTLITRFANVTGIYATDFGTLIREIIYNPAIALFEMFTDAKILFVLLLVLPLGLLPVFSQKRAGLVFLLPLLLLNLLSDFSYHFNPDYPYAFGMAAFFFYLAVDALAIMQMKEDGHRTAARILAIAMASTLVISGFRVAEIGQFSNYIISDRAEVAAMDALLDQVDDHASVSASRRLCPSLAERPHIYTLSHEVETDFVVLDLREEWSLDSEAKYTKEHYEKKGYRVVAETAGVGMVLAK